MKLFQVTNGFHGEGYVRVYVWAATEDEAYVRGAYSFKHNPDEETYPEWWNRLEVKELMDGESEAFATKPSEEGWEVEEK